MGHAEQRFPDDAPVFVGAGPRSESDDVAQDHRAVLPVKQMPIRASQVGEDIVWPVPGRIFPGPVIELALHDAEYRWVSTNEGGEVAGSHHEGLHCLQRDHVRGTDAYLQGGAFTHQLPRPALGQDTLLAVLLYGDLGPAAEDHDHIVGLIAFHDEPGPGRERPRRRDRPECVTLDRVQGLPEDSGAGIALAEYPLLAVMRSVRLALAGRSRRAAGWVRIVPRSGLERPAQPAGACGAFLGAIGAWPVTIDPYRF